MSAVYAILIFAGVFLAAIAFLFAVGFDTADMDIASTDSLQRGRQE